MAILGVLGVVGCGGGDDGHPTDGTWVSKVKNTSCGFAFTFDSAKREYVNQVVCALEQGGFGSEVEIGEADFSVAQKVTMIPRQTSCPDSVFSDHKPVTWEYSLSGNNLSFTDSTGVGTYQRAPDDGDTSEDNILFGCWSEDLRSLTRSPLQNL